MCHLTQLQISIGLFWKRVWKRELEREHSDVELEALYAIDVRIPIPPRSSHPNSYGYVFGYPILRSPIRSGLTNVNE